MIQPKRYICTSVLGMFEMQDAENGDWIYHSDYAALAAENERLKASIQQGKWISDALKPIQSEESGTITIKAPVSSGKTVLVDLFAVEELKAENERLRKAGEWHSKDTLPKEDVDVLCMSGNYMFVGWVDKYGTWQSSDDSRFVPDCWMPLPQAPAKEGRDAK